MGTGGPFVIWLLIICLAPALIFCCLKIIEFHKSQVQNLQELFLSYQEALTDYKKNYNDIQKKELCLQLGREYYSKALPGPYGNRLEHLYTQLDLKKEFLLFQDELVLRDLNPQDSASESSSDKNFPTIPLVS